jgi:D-hexose-6-phosphate mutarotase
MELAVANKSADRSLEFESCLHTYFAVGDIGSVSITGLEHSACVDAVAGNVPRPASREALRITSQTDQTYFDSRGAVEIHDGSWRRKLRIEKTGSSSTVVWNPWTTQRLPDFGPEEHRRMVCVESGNIGRNRLSLRPGGVARMVVEVSSAAS